MKSETQKLKNQKRMGYISMLYGTVNTADGVIEQTRCRFVDDVKSPQFTSDSFLKLNLKLYFYFHVRFIVMSKR